MRSFIFAAAASVLLAVPTRSIAQVVRGTVVDRGTITPQQGVVVLLLDSAGSAVMRTLTDERGEYRLSAARAGTYRVRALRIGFRPSTSGVIALAAGQETLQQPLYAGLPIALDTVRVRGRSACEVRPDSAAATYAVWQQIRTALTAAEITAADRKLTARIVTYSRALDHPDGRVLRQRSAISGNITAVPWRSLTAEGLRKAGYAITEADGSTTYFAPDLSVLVSDAFAGDHCFRLVSESGRLGIAFEPIRERRRIPDIEGTIWLDRASAELRGLEFRYVNMTREEEDVAGGQLEFVRLANGAWLISRWQIRVPVIETRYATRTGYVGVGRVLGRTVREIRVDGGDLALITWRRDTLWSRPPLTVAGVVRDSQTAAGVSSARVALRGTALEAKSDSSGRFRIFGVIPGEYTLDITTPSLDSIGITQSMPLAFTDAATEVVVRVPTAERMVSSLCAGKQGGMVAGRVRTGVDSVFPAGVRVAVEWNVFAVTTAGFQKRWRYLDARTDARGIFRICGVPPNTALVARAESDNGAAKVAARIPTERQFTSVELLLDSATRSNVLTGVVLSDVNGAPIADVEVALPALAKHIFTNEEGGFRLDEIPRGTQNLIVRKIGYKQLSTTVTFDAARTVERRLLLSRVVTLDTVSVRASNLPEFNRNREMGLGHFLTRQDLEKQQHRDLAEVVAQMPGVSMRRNGSRGYIAGRRAAATSILTEAQVCAKLRFEFKGPEPPCACYAHVYVDDVLVYGGLEGETVPDINQIPTASIDAIEYYAGPAQTPARHSRLNSQCGVLVVHTRRTGRGGR